MLGIKTQLSRCVIAGALLVAPVVVASSPTVADDGINKAVGNFESSPSQLTKGDAAMLLKLLLEDSAVSRKESAEENRISMAENRRYMEVVAAENRRYMEVAAADNKRYMEGVATENRRYMEVFATDNRRYMSQISLGIAGLSAIVPILTFKRLLNLDDKEREKEAANALKEAAIAEKAKLLEEKEILKEAAIAEKARLLEEASFLDDLKRTFKYFFPPRKSTQFQK